MTSTAIKALVPKCRFVIAIFHTVLVSAVQIMIPKVMQYRPRLCIIWAELAQIFDPRFGNNVFFLFITLRKYVSGLFTRSHARSNYTNAQSSNGVSFVESLINKDT